MSFPNKIWQHIADGPDGPVQLTLSPYTDRSDVFECTAAWHRKCPEFLKGFGKFNKFLNAGDGQNVPGWVIPVRLRDEFLLELNKKIGLTEPCSRAKVAVRQRVRAQAVPRLPPVGIVPTQMFHDVETLIPTTLKVVKLDAAIHIASPNSQEVTMESDQYIEQGWYVALWTETPQGAITVLKKD